MFNEYVAMYLYRARIKDAQRDSHARELADVISDYKAQRRHRKTRRATK